MVRSRRFPVRIPFPTLPPALLPVLLLILAGPGAAPARAQAPDPATLAAFRQDPMSFFFDLRATDAVACGQALLQDDSMAGAERQRVLTTLAAVHLASGRAPQARAAVLAILSRDPRADLAHPETLPPPLVSLFYGLRDSVLLASGDAPAEASPAPDIHTLAVGDIENNSILSGKYNLDAFAKGLTQIMITDLQDATPLTLVDRQRLNVLRDEIKMNQNAQITDPRYRVPLGRLTGAQSFLFGSLMQVDKKTIRLDLRWVDTSTGEILLADGVEGKLGSSDDLFKLERTVLLDHLVPRLQKLLGGGDLQKAVKPYLERKKKSLPKGTSYVNLLLKTGDAILAEDRGDLAAARTAWSEVAQMNPDNAEAGGRARALTAYLAMNTEDGR